MLAATVYLQLSLCGQSAEVVRSLVGIIAVKVLVILLTHSHHGSGACCWEGVGNAAGAADMHHDSVVCCGVFGSTTMHKHLH